jgi:hypothetical protein
MKYIAALSVIVALLVLGVMYAGPTLATKKMANKEKEKNCLVCHAEEDDYTLNEVGNCYKSKKELKLCKDQKK